MYIVIETQTNADGTVGVIPTPYSDESTARNKYYTILAAAAVSNVPIHTGFLITDTGSVIESRCFKHTETADE